MKHVSLPGPTKSAAGGRAYFGLRSIFPYLFVMVLFFSAQTEVGFGEPLPATQGKASKQKISNQGKGKIKDGKRVLHMNEIEIFGNVEKPKAMFIIPRTPHRYYSEEYKRDFSAEILTPINKQWVENRQQWQKATAGP